MDIDWGSLINGAAGAGSALFGGSNAYDAYSSGMQKGQNQIGQYLNQAEGYLDPYRQAGQAGITGYENALAPYNDPMGYYNKIAGNYQMSPGAQFRMKTGMDAVRNAMASQGFGGSGNEAKGLTDYTQGVINQDQNQYINSVLGIGQTGLQGYGNLMGQGFNAANASGNYAMNAGQDIASMQAAMANAASQNANNNQNNLWGGMGAIASASPSFF